MLSGWNGIIPDNKIPHQQMRDTCKILPYTNRDYPPPVEITLHPQRWYEFCMVFNIRWIFLTTSLRIPPKSLATRVGFWDEWWEIHLTWKTIQNSFSRILYTLRHFNQANFTGQSCRSWKPCETDLSHNCSLHGGMSEVCENTLHQQNMSKLKLWLVSFFLCRIVINAKCILHAFQSVMW